MSIETPGYNTPKEVAIKTPEKRSEIVEEVFKRYHKDLISWCKYKFMKKHIDTNRDIDAKDIVQRVYQNLLTSENPIDLNRSEYDIRAHLNTYLDHAISHFIQERYPKKKIPAENLISLESIFDGKEEDDLPLKLKEYFMESPDYIHGILHDKIEEALTTLARRNKKMADIIRERYLKEKTLQQIADNYHETRQNIESLEKKALKILKNIINGTIKSDLSIPKEKMKKKPETDSS